MSEKTAFPEKGEAERILESADGKIEGQTMDDDKLSEAQARLAAQAERDHQLEAAGFTEEIIKFLNEQWNERGFTPEQRIFSIALATVNLRQHFPEERGGKEFFDKVAEGAWAYFANAKS